jgi:hypothetical protein
MFRQVQVFKELVSDTYPACFQGFPEAMVGQFEDGYVAFEGMQDQDVPGDQCGSTLRLSMRQAGTSATGKMSVFPARRNARPFGNIEGFLP